MIDTYQERELLDIDSGLFTAHLQGESKKEQEGGEQEVVPTLIELNSL